MEYAREREHCVCEPYRAGEYEGSRTNSQGLVAQTHTIDSLDFHDNNLTNNTNEGIVIGGGSNVVGCSIMNNKIYNNGSNTKANVLLQSLYRTNQKYNFIFSKNQLLGYGAAGARAKFGLWINVTNRPSYLNIEGNSFDGNFLTTLGMTIPQSLVAIRNCPGLNPFGAIANPFGNTIATPFDNTNNALGNSTAYSSSFAATPTSAITYTVSSPVDVTIAAGTVQTITTNDDFGNIIDNAVSTLTHRLLRENYTITVTFTAVGAVTVVQASVGLGGTTATMAANVNYVVCGCDCYLVDGSGLTALAIKDGSSNTGGTAIYANIGTVFPISGLLMPVGYNFNATAVTTSPTVVGN